LIRALSVTKLAKLADATSHLSKDPRSLSGVKITVAIVRI
jgi:hypothetical protein